MKRVLEFYVSGMNISKKLGADFSFIKRNTDTLKLHFSFSSEWNNYKNVVCFMVGDKTIHEPIMNGYANVPIDATKENIKFYISGMNQYNDNDKVDSRCIEVITVE